MVQQWLEGKTRDQIAVDNGLSAGLYTIVHHVHYGWAIAETSAPWIFAVPDKLPGIR